MEERRHTHTRDSHCAPSPRTPAQCMAQRLLRNLLDRKFSCQHAALRHELLPSACGPGHRERGLRERLLRPRPVRMGRWDGARLDELVKGGRVRVRGEEGVEQVVAPIRADLRFEKGVGGRGSE